MTHDRPPRAGLTRKNTGYPACPYQGWYWRRDELPEIERRNGDGTWPEHPQTHVPGGPEERKPATATCAGCGKRLVASVFDQPRVWCSTSCKNAAMYTRRREREPAQTVTCVICETSFITRRDRNGRLPRTCSKSCGMRLAWQRRRQASVSAS